MLITGVCIGHDEVKDCQKSLTPGPCARESWVELASRPSARAILNHVDPTGMPVTAIENHAYQGNKTKSLTSGVIGLLTGPHQTSFSEDSSLTIRLSDGERPVFAPE